MGATALENMAKYCEEGKVRDTMLEYVTKHVEMAEKIDATLRAQRRDAKNASKIAEWFATKGIEFKFAGKHDTSDVIRSAVSGADKAIATLEREARTYSLAKPEICEYVRKTIELEREFKEKIAEANGKD